MVMRGYAFYKNGLTVSQRGLLREITMELQNAVDDSSKAGISLPHVFFSPELSRVLFPENLPADLASRIGAYQVKKAGVKKQLYDLVSAHDGAHFASLRYSFEGLAKRQKALLAEIEGLAEEIRVGLAELPPETLPVEYSPCRSASHRGWRGCCATAPSSNAMPPPRPTSSFPAAMKTGPAFGSPIVSTAKG
jgi:hypothetical protein